MHVASPQIPHQLSHRGSYLLRGSFILLIDLLRKQLSYQLVIRLLIHLNHEVRKLIQIFFPEPQDCVLNLLCRMDDLERRFVNF